ncbi:hypothetical protein AB0B66_10350 [Catellatospora sp. NPDC049111]|uniref:hypothetical protein n=1 Tax=Catellatospora sp. NPDC049111 TaxID=3155271 RepID=UPI0033F12DE6
MDAIAVSVNDYLTGCGFGVDRLAVQQVVGAAVYRQLAGLWQARDRNRCLYEAYAACFPDPMQALLFLSHAADIGVAYLDRDVIENDLDRTVTDEEWERLAPHLANYDEYVSSVGDLNLIIIRDMVRLAGLSETDDGPEPNGEDPQPAAAVDFDAPLS